MLNFFAVISFIIIIPSCNEDKTSKSSEKIESKTVITLKDSLKGIITKKKARLQRK